MGVREKVIEALSAEGMALEDYDETVFVVVGSVLVADSETEETARSLVSRARSYGEEAFSYAYKPSV